MTGAFRGADDIGHSQWADAEIAAVGVLGTTELAGALVVQRWHETRIDGSFEMVNVFMSDPVSGDLLLYSFDTAGFPADPPARGRWADGRADLLRSTPRGQARTSFWATAGGFGWTKTYRRDEDHPWTTVVEGALTQQHAEEEVAR
jgi:hypothetical protein